MNEMLCSSDFVVERIEHGIAFVVDLNLGRTSVTNDAACVCRYVALAHGCTRVVYKDSIGEWSEIKLTAIGRNITVDFLPWHGIVHDLLKRDY